MAQMPPNEQKSFCDNDAPYDLRLKAAPLPHSVLSALMTTKEAKDVRRGTKNDEKPLEMASLFRGAKVNLGADPDDTFVVIGEFPMSGADNTWFWVVRRSGEKATILLWAAANCLDIHEKSNGGLRDVETTWSSASEARIERYVFDGIHYRLTERKSRPVSW